jgi:hypothetical protein
VTDQNADPPEPNLRPAGWQHQVLLVEGCRTHPTRIRPDHSARTSECRRPVRGRSCVRLPSTLDAEASSPARVQGSKRPNRRPARSPRLGVDCRWWWETTSPTRPLAEPWPSAGPCRAFDQPRAFYSGVCKRKKSPIRVTFHLSPLRGTFHYQYLGLPRIRS